MATQDISRHLHQPEKRYSSARMQKGRVLLDSDINEGEVLDDEAQRVVVVDVVGRHGSPDSGFSIENVSEVSYDFDILAGTYYLGGMRHEIVGPPVSPGAQSFRAQSNWLQANRVGAVPAPPKVPVVVRNDLVYLVGWEQVVSAVEDAELLDGGLGGLDTSARVRRMNRVYVKDGGANNCAQAFDALVTSLTSTLHTFDATSGELRSGARLTVGVDPDPEPDDLCSPGGPGYKGAENQAIRIQLIAPNKFLWSYDNAAPLYRIIASVEGDVVTVYFQTPPRRQELFPLKGQILEILPWGAKLANGEKVADHPIAANIGGGVFARVETSYNPRTRTLTASIVDATTLEHMLDWFALTPVVPEAERYLYLRVWNPGDVPPGEEDEESYGIAFAANVAVPLEGTGLTVKFNQAGIVGDHWIIAARPNTPGTVAPWELSSGAVPHGPRRFYCPLAIIRWKLVGDPEVVSCRRRFRPLTRIGGCYNVTVGDGATSHGDYTSIQEAILALPPDEPGRVRVLPGVYEERIHIVGRKNVVVEGCGPRTLVRTPPGNTTSQALFMLEQCEDFTLRDFAVEAIGQFGVGVAARLESAAPIPSQRIALENLVVTTRRDPTLDRPSPRELGLTDASAAFPLCTVAALGVYDLKIVGCTLTMIGDLSAAANVLLAACVRAAVRDCKIATPRGVAKNSRAWGGLHIAGLCYDVLVEGCEIHEGLGYGITLGSIRQASEPVETTQGGRFPNNSGVITAGGDCPGLGGGFSFDVTAADERPNWVPDPGPQEIRIYDNHIHGMGSSGISVLGFFPEVNGLARPQIETPRLVIADNIIEDNYRHPAEEAPTPGLQAVVAFGGIVLADADGLRIHDNRIQGNGVDHRRPVCGVYVLHGEDIVVENNRIQGNGPRVPGSALSGHRAGIALQLVGRRVGIGAQGQLDVELESARPAARVRGNVVTQPAGRALQIYGIGPMFVEGNALVSQGLDGVTAEERKYAAHCVEIQNIGQSSELIQKGVLPAFLAFFPKPAMYEPAVADVRLHDGRVLFTDNQVRFNPVVGAGNDVFCATRILSYGDVAVLGNQFFANLAPDEGVMAHDTIAVGWSVRCTLNRWEDPFRQLGALGPLQTTVSAQTFGHVNVTTLNQASRCIHAHAPDDTDIANNPTNSENQILSTEDCEEIEPQ